MTPFLTTNWHKSGNSTKALDDECANAAAADEKEQNVRRRIIMNVPKSAIGMNALRATALVLVFFTLCASLVVSAHAEQQQQQQQPDEFVALQYPEALEESLVPYPTTSAAVDNDAGSLFLQKRFLVPPRRMLKFAQMMKNGGRRREAAAAAADTRAEAEQDAADINGEQDGRRWRQNNGGAWAKRHIKGAVPTKIQKLAKKCQQFIQLE
uniref:Secreted protein n=1 Tax=Globodera pallida TaxID=36090 RepID=A0A183C8G6_GLOPA